MISARDRRREQILDWAETWLRITPYIRTDLVPIENVMKMFASGVCEKHAGHIRSISPSQYIAEVEGRCIYCLIEKLEKRLSDAENLDMCPDCKAVLMKWLGEK